jgi:hypothetical protein
MEDAERMTLFDWSLWGLVLVIQNVSFTFVSRARNSGSLKRHMIASLMSNGVWFASQLMLLGPVIDMIKGSQGLMTAVAAGAYYTTMTMGGSFFAHWLALKTEKGKSAVGANAKYAQITTEEWREVQLALGYLANR